MKAPGLMTKLMVLAPIPIKMAANIKATGLKINNTAKVKSHGQMALHMKETTKTALRMERAHSSGLMEANT